MCEKIFSKVVMVKFSKNRCFEKTVKKKINNINLFTFINVNCKLDINEHTEKIRFIQFHSCSDSVQIPGELSSCMYCFLAVNSII